MRTEIRTDVREYILNEVNTSLARLGISEKVVETKEFEDRYENLLEYQFKSAPIKQMPMMFKTLQVGGYMTAYTPKDENENYYNLRDTHFIIIVNLHYNYDHFDGGSNGCTLGRMIFLVDKDLPARFDEKEYIEPRTYIRKVEGLNV